MGIRIEQDFPAVLKTPENKLLEYGTGRASVADGYVEFKSEFVPLFKMGTRLRIVRVKDEVETQVFTGEVYLSSEKMLRLVSVRDEVLPGAVSAYLYDVKLSGSASAMILPQEQPRRFFPFGSRQGAVPVWQEFPVTVYALSLGRLKFTCSVPLAQGQRFTVSVGEPPLLEDITLEVELPVAFGEGETGSYRCRILDLFGENQRRLEELLRELSLAANKAFPPAAGSATAPASPGAVPPEPERFPPPASS